VNRIELGSKFDPSSDDSSKLNRVQLTFRAEPRWCNENSDWTKVRVEFEPGSSLIVIGALGPEGAWSSEVFVDVKVCQDL